MKADDPFFADYAKAIDAMHKLPASDKRNWRNQALTHLTYCTHGTQDFAHWHRWYLSSFEKICGELIGKADFALAYWDWQDEGSNVPDSFFDVNGLNTAFWKDPSDAQADHWSPSKVMTDGNRGIPRATKITSNPQYAKAFLAKNLEVIRKQSDFGIFTNMLERQPHNLCHGAVGYWKSGNGHMSDGMSPLDPVFWLHHCNIDRLWAEWQAAENKSFDPKNSYDNNFCDAKGELIAKASSTDALALGNFGYTYDTLDPTALANEAAKLNVQAFSAVDTAHFSSLKITAPVPLASSPVKGGAIINQGLQISIKIPTLVKSLSESRVFRAPHSLGIPRSALEPRRLVARLDGVKRPTSGNVTVGVFVNCPYLSPDTPTTDLHCAGVFTFFGPGGGHAHAGHPGSDSVYIDVSDTVRALASDGRLASTDFTLQVMAVSASGEIAADSTVSIDSVTILST